MRETPYGRVGSRFWAYLELLGIFLMIVGFIAFIWFYAIPSEKARHERMRKNKEIIVVGSTEFSRKVVDRCEYLRASGNEHNQWFHKGNCTNSFHLVKISP